MVRDDPARASTDTSADGVLMVKEKKRQGPGSGESGRREPEGICWPRAWVWFPYDCLPAFGGRNDAEVLREVDDLIEAQRGSPKAAWGTAVIVNVRAQ